MAYVSVKRANRESVIWPKERTEALLKAISDMLGISAEEVKREIDNGNVLASVSYDFYAIPQEAPSVADSQIPLPTEGEPNASS